VHVLLRSPFERRAHKELLHVVLTFVLAAFGFAYVSALLLGAGLLAVTAIGIPLLAFGVLGARRCGTAHRALAA
jgi:hypothetical protein